MARAIVLVEPSRKIGPQLRERRRLAEPRLRERFDFTVGIGAPGEHAIERDAEREDVGAFIRGRAGKQLRRHVTARAGHLERFAFVEPAQTGNAEIDDLQPAVRLEHHVLGLDVAVNDAGAMQRGHRLRELECDVETRRERDRRTAHQASLQRFAGVERQHSVQTGAPFGGRLERFGDERTAT